MASRRYSSTVTSLSALTKRPASSPPTPPHACTLPRPRRPPRAPEGGRKRAPPVVRRWLHLIFPNLRFRALGVPQGVRRKPLQPPLEDSASPSTRRRPRHAAFRSLLGIAAAHQPLS